jgi:glucosamine--fructose-6-phosphate aminotransferase (isomerizing)
MSYQPYVSPILSPEFALDDHARQVIVDLYEKERAKSLILPTDDPLDPKRRQRVEITWDEMQVQPEVIRKTLDLERDAIRSSAEFFATESIDRIIMAGCGDSLASMIGVRYAFECLLNVHTEVIQALDFAYYYNRYVDPRTLVITLSSSGATTRVVEAMFMARLRGAKSLSLSNTPGSPLMVEADRGILIHAERKGWPTQSSTAAMATLLQFLIDYAAACRLDRNAIQRFQADLDHAPDWIATVLAENNEIMLQIAQAEWMRKMYLFTGGGPCYAAAIFGAAKVKECSPDQALAIQMEEFHHYNSLKAGDPLFILAPDGYSLPRAVDTAREAKRWGGQVYSLVTKNNAALNDFSDMVFRLPAVPEEFSALVYTIPLQLFGYHVAMEKFRRAEIEFKGKD